MAPPATGRFAAAAVVAAAMLGGLTVVLAGPWLAPGAKEVVSDVALIPLALAVALACGRTARRAQGRVRLAWGLLATAGVCWTLGELAWFLNRYLAATPADPSAADLFYLAGLLPAAGSMLAFFAQGAAQTDRVRTLLGALVVGGAVLFVSKALALSVIFPAASKSPPLAKVVYLAYPIADIVLASLALIVLMRVGSSARLPLTLVAVGFLAYAGADTWYSYQGALDRYTAGSVLDVGWAAGYLLLALASLAPGGARPDAGADSPASERTSGLTSLAVYVPLLVAVVVAAIRPSPPDDPVLVVSGAAVLLLFGLRQVLLAADNSRLRRDLEGRVVQLQQRSAELRRLARQTERVVASVVEGVLEVDADGLIRFVNPSAAHMLGRPPEELCGSSEHEVFADPHPAAQARPVESGIAAALRTGTGADRVDAVFARADGSTFPVELTVGPVVEDGRALGAVVVFRDVTERREVERMKDEFISVVSHELRTPLTSIRGSLGLLAGGAAGELPARALRMVTIALDSSERLTRLINDMLDIERIESGMSMMELSDCDAAGLVDTALEGVHALADEKRLELVVDRVEGRVWADADRIVQTLTNLLGNAMKFSPPASTITVEAVPRDGMLEFSVRDRGRGIPADRVGRIFERFEQVDSSDSRQKGGTGLGLAISRSIVERHGGRIWAESTPGEGSTFRFTLPALPPPATGPDPADHTRGHPTVLLCDDDGQIREVVGAMLERRGYQVRAVAGARDAISRAATDQPDVILLDLRMPGMSGWEAVDALKADERTRDIPVVVMSGVSPGQDRRLQARTQGWLEKPVSEAAMSQAVGATLRDHLNRPRVLLVEDDEALADVLVATLERDGLTPVHAAGQKAALALSQDLRPDAVVLDLDLADGDGFGVVQALRGDPALAAVPLIVYSGREVMADEREQLSLGRTLFLTKGRATSEELARHVLAVLGLVSSVRQS